MIARYHKIWQCNGGTFSLLSVEQECDNITGIHGFGAVLHSIVPKMITDVKKRNSKTTSVGSKKIQKIVTGLSNSKTIGP